MSSSFARSHFSAKRRDNVTNCVLNISSGPVN